MDLTDNARIRRLVEDLAQAIEDVALWESLRGLLALTEREMEVARLVAQGFSAKQMAARLGRGQKTIETQRASIGRKLHIEGTGSLVGALVLRAVAAHLAAGETISPQDLADAGR